MPAKAVTSSKKSQSIRSTTIEVEDICLFSNENGHLASISVIVAQDGGIVKSASFEHAFKHLYLADLEQEITDWHTAYEQKISPPYKVVATVDPSSACENLLKRKLLL